MQGIRPPAAMRRERPCVQFTGGMLQFLIRCRGVKYCVPRSEFPLSQACPAAFCPDSMGNRLGDVSRPPRTSGALTMITYLCRSALAAVAALGVGAALAEAAIRVEAYRGEPFGVGRVTVDLPQDDAPSADDRFAITEAGDRVLYPVLGA